MVRLPLRPYPKAIDVVDSTWLELDQLNVGA